MSATILHGDCLDMMRGLPADSVDAIVTDPPYELGFMGKHWDASGVAYNVATWAEAFRVLRPGGHLLAFGGTRTYHRMACAIEDAGFEIRDTLQWLYGSGFPKSLDVSKAIDKAAGAEREIVGQYIAPDGKPRGVDLGIQGGAFGAGVSAYQPEKIVTAPATPEAERWQGWGTALKPANEPIVMARKPLAEPTVAANVLTHGTGALNIDGCRVPGQPWQAHDASGLASVKFFTNGDAPIVHKEPHTAGRWPANVILSHSLFCTDDACADDCPVAMLDAQSGERKAGVAVRSRSGGNTFGGNSAKPPMPDMGYGDKGGASRFYYVAKASRKERRGSKHPTVKPVALMRYLIRLVTPPGGTVLDPFAGSGTTGEAAILEGVNVVLIEREAEYVADIRARLDAVAPLETAAD